MHSLFTFCVAYNVAACGRSGGYRRSCLPGLRCGGGGRQAGATVLSCPVWRCELSWPDHPTSAFCVRVRPAVAPAVLACNAPPDTLQHCERTCKAVGPTQFTPPHQTQQDGPSRLCRVWCAGVNWTIVPCNSDFKFVVQSI